MENCFLVLDLLNRTGEEMELTYAGKKQLQIETGDVCRYVLWLFILIFQNMIDISSILFAIFQLRMDQILLRKLQILIKEIKMKWRKS